MQSRATFLTFGAVALCAMLVAAFYISALIAPKTAKANSADNLVATVATTSNPTVTTTGALVFATSTCVSRTISTVASPIMITFTDAQGKVPTALFGFQQAASTTVTYDASQYGCGALKVYSFVTSAITVQEAR